MANCFYCERPFTDHGYRRETFNHVVPLSKGGVNHKGRNGVTCCLGCNGHKGDKTLLQFIRYMKSPVKGYTEAERFTVIRNTQFLIDNRLNQYKENLFKFRSLDRYKKYIQTL